MKQRKEYRFRVSGRDAMRTRFTATDERGNSFALTLDKDLGVIHCECPTYQRRKETCEHTAALRRHLTATAPKRYGTRVLANPARIATGGRA